MNERDPFWQEFALRICWLLGVKADNVSTIDIRIKAGKCPEVTITKDYSDEGVIRQVFDVFKAASWEAVERAPEQTFREFLADMNKRRN